MDQIIGTPDGWFVGHLIFFLLIYLHVIVKQLHICQGSVELTLHFHARGVNTLPKKQTIHWPMPNQLGPS